MKLYNIYKNPSGAIEAVKQGWSWPGFFFTWIWAFVKGLNGLGAGILIGAFILSILSIGNEALNVLITLVGFGISIWLGAHGNQLRGDNLVKKGFEMVESINSETPEGAIAAFMKEQNSVGNAS